MSELAKTTSEISSSAEVKFTALLRKITPAKHSGLGPGIGRPKSRITSLGELKARQPSSSDPRIPAASSPFDMYTSSGEWWEGKEGVAVSVIHFHREQTYWQDKTRLCSSLNGMRGRSSLGVEIHPDGPLRDCAIVNQYGGRQTVCPFAKAKSVGDGSWGRADCERKFVAIVVIGDCEDLVSISFKGSSFSTAADQLYPMLEDQETLWSRQFIIYTQKGERPTYCFLKVKPGELNSAENNEIYARISEEYSKKYDEMCNRMYSIQEPRTQTQIAPATQEPVTSSLDSDEDPEF